MLPMLAPEADEHTARADARCHDRRRAGLVGTDTHAPAYARCTTPVPETIKASAAVLRPLCRPCAPCRSVGWTGWWSAMPTTTTPAACRRYRNNYRSASLQASYPMPGAISLPQGRGLDMGRRTLRISVADCRRGSGSDNDNSCVLRIEAGGRSVLLTGDISKNAEQQLLALHGARLASEIIVVPHHGSKTSSSAAFLQAVKPKLALVSSGFQNRFRHPNHQVVQRYHIQGAQVVNSVDSGWAELESGPGGWRWLNRARVEGRRYWHRASPQESSDGY